MIASHRGALDTDLDPSMKALKAKQIQRLVELAGTISEAFLVWNIVMQLIIFGHWKQLWLTSEGGG